MCFHCACEALRRAELNVSALAACRLSGVCQRAGDVALNTSEWFGFLTPEKSELGCYLRCKQRDDEDKRDDHEASGNHRLWYSW